MAKSTKITREFSLGLIVLVLFVFLSVATSFFGVSGLYSFMLDVSPTLIGGIGMALLIITGNIDLSAGTILGFVAYVSAILAKSGVPFYLFVPASIAVGVALAGLNGFITVKCKVPSIVVTLAMNLVHLGFYVTFLPDAGWVEALGHNYLWFGRGRFFGVVPYTFVVALVVAVLFMLIMRYTRLGKHLYAVGGNRQSAEYSGIKPDSMVMKAFLLEGLLLGIAALTKAMTSDRVMPSYFQGREMIFIAAAVVGGVSITGGSGKILGVVFGAALVYLLSIAMIYLGFQDYFQFALQGIIILVAVWVTVTDFSGLKRRLSRRRP